MALKIYRIDLETEKASVFSKFPGFEKAAEKVGFASIGAPLLLNLGRIAGASVAAPLAVVAAPTVIAVAAGVGIYAYLNKNSSEITVVTKAEDLEKLRTHDGSEFVNKSFYAQHPKDRSILLPTSCLHDIVLSEQIAELTAFLRSKLRVTHLHIEVRTQRDGSAGAKANVNGVSGGGEMSMHHLHLSEMRMSYANPELVPLAAPLLWIEDFQKVQKAVEGATGGTALFREVQNLSFGIKADLAQQVGISAEWLSSRTFTIEVEFG